MPAHRAIVTGGSRGIGRAIVDRLHADGEQVLTCGRGPRPVGLPAGIHWVQADVARADDARRVVATAHELLGGVSLLVNNAGVQITKSLPDTTDADWDLLVGVNCRGVFNTCRAALPRMAVHGGVIVNIGSISADVADPGMALYNASKAFVAALTRSIAVDHGPRVRCNTVQPGWIHTAMADAAFATATDPGAARGDAERRHPASRLGRPADIAHTVAWLASDQADFVTGQTFTIDGGLTAASPLRPEQP